MPEPQSLITHLANLGYHSRSSKHGDAMVYAIVEDLMRHCPRIASHAAADQIVYSVKHKLVIGTDTWNTDLAIGTAPPGGVAATVPRLAGMAQMTPVHVRVAVEAKAVLTKHSGARRNRKRDLEAHHDHVHRYRPQTVAAGLVVVNQAQQFFSPVPPAGIRHHRQPQDAAGVVNVIRGVTRSNGAVGSAGLEAMGVLVVDMDNINLATTKFVTRGPAAPTPGDPLHWDTFIADICAAYSTRYP